MWRSKTSYGAWEETWSADLKAVKGQGPWGSNVGNNIASDAEWIWRNGYAAIQIQFRFANLFGAAPASCTP